MNISITRRGLKCNIGTIVVHMFASFICSIVPHFSGLSSKVIVGHIGFQNNGAMP